MRRLRGSTITARSRSRSGSAAPHDTRGVRRRALRLAPAVPCQHPPRRRTERRVVLAYDVFAKTWPLLDAEDAADGAGCAAYGHSYDGPNRPWARLPAAAPSSAPRKVPCACPANVKAMSMKAATGRHFIFMITPPVRPPRHKMEPKYNRPDARNAARAPYVSYEPAHCRSARRATREISEEIMRVSAAVRSTKPTKIRVWCWRRDVAAK